MLRSVALALTAILSAAFLAAAAAGWHTLPFVLAPLILLLGLLFERYVYKPIRTEPPGPEWDRTPEKFADPRSGQPVVVYYNPRTGERRYVADTGS
jgi:fatty acid desaturase